MTTERTVGYGCRRRLWAAHALALYLCLSSPRGGRAEDHVSFKWQDYAEDDGRIRVISRYLGFEKEINANLVLKAHGVHDAISGASPLGAPSRDGGETVPKGELTDVREAGVVDLDWIHGLHRTSFQYAYSDEPDFLSKGYSITNTTEINKRNTGLTLGASWVDDDVRPRFFEVGRKKDSFDLLFGLSQVVDKNTVVTLNLTYGENDGYLNDPYKLATQDVLFEPLPGFEILLPDTQFRENRPNARERRIVFGNIKRFFPQIDASVDIDYRYFDDDWGIESHTFDIEWYQKIGERWVIRPKYRLYRQSSADFYAYEFDDVDFELNDDQSGVGPYWTADYRLAKLETESLGLKIVFKLNERLSFDVSYERYKMKGRDEETIADAFPSADVVTIGSVLWF